MLSGYRTIIAAGVALFAALMREAGVELDEEGLTNSILIIGGAAAAIHFRLVARRNLRDRGLR